MFYSIDNVTGDTKKIYSPNELTQMLNDTFTYYQQETVNARAQASKTHEEVAAEIQNKYVEENAQLRENLRFSYGFFSSEKELNAWRTFCERHEKCRLRTKISGGKMPYVIPYDTGVGQCVTAVCQVCGEKENITDTSVW